MSKVSPLDYVPAPVPEDCVLKISPSSFSKFVEKPWQWYREQVQGLDKFEYSTATVTGTIVHYCAECAIKGEEVDKQAIEEYIQKHAEKEDYSIETVSRNWYPTAHALINEFTMQHKNQLLSSEVATAMSIGNGIYVAGTFDLLLGTKEDCMLIDYKTYSSKVKPKSIPSYYKAQLLTYTRILRSKGYNVTRIGNVFVNVPIDGGISEKTGKPLKSYPSETTVLIEQVEESDVEWIESMHDLCRDTYLLGTENPDLLHIIYHDPRLKEI